MCCNKTTISMNKRRSRARKSRKPKFLSLRHQFPPNQPQSPPSAAASAAAVSRQLNLFPLHPENDREIQDQAENVALFFSSADGGDTSLTGLLDNSAAAESISSHADNNSSRLDYLSPSSRYAYGEERAALVRNALRSRDRDSSEEKWVYYSEVVERKVLKEEEVSSSAVDRRPASAAAEIQRVSLKLDYEEIMNAWSNKGPLYIDAESCSQIVPDINHDFVPHENSSYNGVSWGCNVGLWAVPEMVGDSKNGEIRTKNNNEDEIKNNLGTREASLLRYKEKRQNRLFSKKIRYQVRKLNAEKRPRIKGRFVKRN